MAYEDIEVLQAYPVTRAIFERSKAYIKRKYTANGKVQFRFNGEFYEASMEGDSALIPANCTLELRTEGTTRILVRIETL